MRIVLRNRNVRSFVRSVKKRTEKARERGLTMRETRVEKSRKNPRSSAVQMQKCRSLLREVEKVLSRKDYNEAQALLIQVLTLEPDNVQAGAQLAKLYLVTDRNAKAEALYRELLTREEDVSFYANLGLACYMQRKFAEACEAYQQALNMDPKNPERAAALGRACMAAGHLEEAAELLEFASERMPRDIELLTVLGTCYEQLKKPRLAEGVYKKIHTLKPYDEAVKQKLNALASM